MDILISVPGRTDPIRSCHDGPILYITRHYRPQVSYLLLTAEIAKDELEYHYLEDAIHTVDPDCQVKTVETHIEKVFDYDSLARELPRMIYEIQESHPDGRFLVNISSGTPQICGVLCMLCLSDAKYSPIQINTPENKANRAIQFFPGKDDLQDWFATNEDHEYEAPVDENRVKRPALNIFKLPMLRSQILSLIENYDYAGAYEMFSMNRDVLPERVGILLDHGRKRLNLEYSDAQKLIQHISDRQLRDELCRKLLPGRQATAGRLVEFFLSMQIKQKRKELNDFVLRIEILSEYLSIYILENCMNVKLEEITTHNNRGVYRTSEERAEAKMPGIACFMNQQFPVRGYEWGKEINARSMMLFVTFLAQQETYQKYRSVAEELARWVKVANEVRNRAAHTMDFITEEMIADSYSQDSQSRRGSGQLCGSIKAVMIQVFGAKNTDFTIYETINELCRQYFDNSSV